MADIVDSGSRKEFESGAVRDITEGKGAEHLLPLDVVASYLNDKVIEDIHLFMTEKNADYLYFAFENFCSLREWDVMTAVMEVSIHFEDGARKYGARNWEKGIPVHCYIDSAIRHYLKWLRGDEDERHDRAFLWNIMCCRWTMEHRPECIDI